MFQRDYFMRMIEQMTQSIGQVVGLRDRKEHLQALAIVDELLDREFRLNSRLIDSLTDQELVGMLTTGGVLDHGSLQGIARLLREKGEIYEEQGDPEASYAALLKSLHLFLYGALEDAEPATAEPREEIDKLQTLLRAYELPEETKRLLLQWEESERHLDRAENLLHELLEDGQMKVQEAESFYLRLLAMPADQLASGRLSLDEVREAYEELQRQGVPHGES
ncbi:DUF6483 family protein [Paenibacillus daejeonensis]|uniref:DUF6483 family protein n=1 Tax=Paenibacillus daejeonensis TaxID=135193 RepID=UPI000370ACCE|nr:DUF6483 family protein [Paenibacillus daejeonensis]